MNDSQGAQTPGKPFHWRGLISFLVTLGFLLLAVTGFALYLTPQGRVAHWTGWRLAGLGKEQWAAMHMLSGLLFLVAACFHLYFNWALFIHYIKTRAGFNLKREMGVAIAIIFVLVAGTLWELPPFQYVVDANDRIKTYWDARSIPAPYPHAEVSTLEDFANRMEIPLDDLQSRLADLGLSDTSVSMTIQEASDQLDLSPNALYRQLGYSTLGRRPGRAATGRGAGTGLGVGTMESKGSDSPLLGGGSGRGGDGESGWGRQMIQQVCLAQGIDLQEAINALAANGIRASGDDTVRSLANHTQLMPSEIIEMIGGRSGGSGRRNPFR